MFETNLTGKIIKVLLFPDVIFHEAARELVQICSRCPQQLSSAATI